MFSKIGRGTMLAAVAATLTLAVYQDADAHTRRRHPVVHRTVVVRPAPVVVRPTVVVRPSPVIVRYYPAQHTHCVVRSGYYYAPAFGYHRHTHHPGGIHFGVHLVF
jgi:hypothetical protein